MTKGIRLRGKKDSSLVTWTIRRIKQPEKVRIPLEQSVGGRAIPCVEPGEYVVAGQKIAGPDGPFSVALHASVSGTVSAVGDFPHPLKGYGPAIEITSTIHRETRPEIGIERRGWQSLGKGELLALFRESGLVGLGGEMIPVHTKNSISEDLSLHTLIINGCESEPYVTSDHSLMMSHPLDLLKGAEILRKVLNAERVVFAIEDNKLEVAELIKSKIYFLKWNHFEVRVLPSRYPGESAASLARDVCAIEGREVWQEARTCRSLEPRPLTYARGLQALGVSIQNIATTFAVYEAVVLQKPLYERVVTVAGECVIEPRNLWVPIGMSFYDAFRQCRGLMREPQKVVMGGPMQGQAQTSLEVPVIKGTRAVLALPKEVTRVGKEMPCIHCNQCVEACPAGISPVMITLAAERGLFERARELGVEHCTECGNCTYICPAKRPMNELIRRARTATVVTGGQETGRQVVRGRVGTCSL